MYVYSFGFILSCTWFLTLLTNGPEYLYPVAWSPLQNAFYVIYQKSPETVELWLWDPASGNASLALLTRFTPASFTMLPNNAAFSFIDHGVIKIQSLIKRSPSRVELDRPLYDITQIHWLDDTAFYLSAKERTRYGIYQVNREGKVDPIIINQESDCLYPSKVDEKLFYIERLHNDGIQKERIMLIEYKVNTIPVEGIKEYALQERCCSQPMVLLDLDVPAAFLYMESAENGYFISYPSQVKKTDRKISCYYYQFQKEKTGKWTYFKLFSFDVPSDMLLTGEKRLYESILPLLPRHIGNSIYYVTIGTEYNQLEVHCYNSVLRQKDCIMHSCVAGQHLFVPVAANNDGLYVGGYLVSDVYTPISINKRIPLNMYIGNLGIQIQMPTIQIS
jgi:hypothetical protein